MPLPQKDSSARGRHLHGRISIGFHRLFFAILSMACCIAHVDGQNPISTGFVGGDSADGNTFDLLSTQGITITSWSFNIADGATVTGELFWLLGTADGVETQADAATAGLTSLGTSTAISLGVGTPTPFLGFDTLFVPANTAVGILFVLQGEDNNLQVTSFPAGTVVAGTPLSVALLDGVRGGDFPYGTNAVRAVNVEIGFIVGMGGGAMGDPHFKKFNGQQYDYHGECDLLLLSSSTFHHGLGLHIHLRTTIVDWWSYIETAAIQIGPDTLEISANGLHYLNGVQGSLVDHGVAMDLSSAAVTYKKIKYGKPGKVRTQKKRLDKKWHIFEIDLGNKSKILIKSFHNHKLLAVSVENPHEQDFGQAVGLMGTFESGAMVARDSVTIVEDPGEFGPMWQVNHDDPQLFRIPRAPQYPDQCIVPPVIGTSEEIESDIIRGRRLTQKVTAEEAEEACEDWDAADKHNCIFDIMASGNLELAEAGSY